MRRARFAALAGLALAATTAARAGELSGPSCGTVAIVLSGDAALVRLPHGFVRAGSDSAWSVSGAWLRGRDYVLDRLSGDLRVLRAHAPGETLWVSACWLLAPPPLEYARNVYRPARAPDLTPAAAGAPAALTPRPSTARDPASAPSGASIAVTGNKTIAVDFGSSQDAALRQSLDLSVSGRLAPGVELTGVLSDRATPLSATGATQDLQALDRVLVELKAPEAAAALGDIPLELGRGEFARLDRRLQGVRGEWTPGAFRGLVAAASAQGEYTRMQFVGVDGLQGPYELADRDGNRGITVVAGSEIVTLDGQRMTRGEAADYAIDYERARLTFSNRHPITSASRITVEYQYAVTRFRRNLAAATSEWTRGPWSLYATALTESDDKGRPLDQTLDASDLIALAAAGDSAALGAGVTPGVGDYDTVRVARDTVAFAFAGPDSGQFVVQFARVGQGRGDYSDSALVAGRTTYRWVGPGRGAFRVGRLLPSPESHQLASLGGAVRAGPLRVEAEGAVSKLDRNTFSAIGDGDDAGTAGRVSAALEGGAGALPGRVGMTVGARAVDRRFTSFSRLERPFAEEDWGLPANADLDHQRRADASAWWKPRAGSDVTADLSRLTTPDGYAGTRRRVNGASALGALALDAQWLDSDGTLAGHAFGRAGRTRTNAGARWAGRWLAPSLRTDVDRRVTPGDSAGTETRSRELAADLASGSALPWRLATGVTWRRDEQDAGLLRTRQGSTALRAQVESPATGPLGVSLTAQRRDTRDLVAGGTTRSDLASVRLRADDHARGLSGSLAVETTSEADDRRTRTLSFVGAGRGSYDALGNYVGTGDYDLVLTVDPALDRLARVATSAHAAWAFGTGEAWRGSRVEFTLEDEARRRGGPRLADVFLSTGLALVDPALARGAITQRLEAELAPGSHAAALRARAERRVVADRSFANFAQITDQRTGQLRWRARPDAAMTVETEARVNWQNASQSLIGASAYSRTIVEQGVTSQLAWQPSPRLRVAGAADAAWARPLSQPEFTRTVRVGPDVGVSVGARGRAELSVRRAFIGGPPAVSLLPSADPAGAPRWDGTARFDLRVHETTTFGVTGTVQERPGRATNVNGRAEVRAFF